MPVKNSTIEIWGGIECTINRVNDQYLDQLEYAGHYTRESDIDQIASLGIKMLRYPVIWERHQPKEGMEIDWSFAEKNLKRLRGFNVTPIAGLVHHGSGPEYVNFFDGSFETGLVAYARKVAEKFPWLEFYTPVNEPLTTARFCGLYGHWYPHLADDYSFYKILLSECKATVMALKAIREINPDAKLIQTDDLGKSHSTPLLRYQADFENERRWLSYELLCGKLTPAKPLWQHMLKTGISEQELYYFLDNNCTPHVCGFNYYLTSERYLDEDLSKYPEQYHGGNGRHRYADIETVLVHLDNKTGPGTLLKEAWERLQLPLAITECHLHSPREEQLRWFNEMWKTLNQLKADGVDIRAITAWALFGLYGWNCLVTKPCGDYEPGVFSLRSGTPRPTALAKFIQKLCGNRHYNHPVLEADGWWKRPNRRTYSRTKVVSIPGRKTPACQPVLIIGKTGTLGSAFSRICQERHIHYNVVGRSELDITHRDQIDRVIREINPWAIINTAGFVRVDDAETCSTEECFLSNLKGPALLAEASKKYGIRLLTFSTDLVFDGRKNGPYVENDPVAPLNMYGKSKAKAEKRIQEIDPNALIVRTSSFFGPWDQHNFAYQVLKRLKEQREMTVACDVFISPTYVPDLVNECLDLLLDNESGILHLSNHGTISWADFARKIAVMAGLNTDLIKAVPLKQLPFQAPRPKNSAMVSEKGILLPPIQNALERFFESLDSNYI
ncbi:MAG TPA: family 1 glycosylhydrolase, partial [Sphingobacteriaceae bacterium]